jgi:plasmid stabilization system protein ParE
VKRLKVIVTPDAQEQMLERILQIAKDSVQNALKWEDRLRAAIGRIGELPGHAVDEDATRRLGRTVRKYVFEGAYLIHYLVNESAGTVNIINFRHGARLPRRGEP